MRLVSPFPHDAAAELHRWLNSPREPNFDDFHASGLGDVVGALAVKGRIGFTFALMLDGAPIGFIAFAPASPIMGFFSGMVMAPEYRGRGFGRELLTRVWEELQMRGFKKAVALFFADNEGIQATFRSAGAVEEGILRRASTVAGELVDMRIWSFTEAER